MMIRKGVRGGAGWIFGLSITVLLISIWGRAVVIDTQTMAESLAPLSDSVTVVDIFTDWIESELADTGVDAAVASGAIESVLGSSEVGEALERFVVEVVEASASVDPAGSSVDVASLLTPAAPEIAHALASAGVPVPVDQVETLVEGLDPFVVRQPSSVSYLGAASPVAVRFGTAAVLSLVVMLVSGWVAVATSDERLVEVQRLLARVALGALSYAVILRVGSWILDPDGGRAPLVETVSSIAGSKWLVPMAIASGAALLSGAVWLVGRSVRPEATSPLPVEAPKPQEERELSRIG